MISRGTRETPRQQPERNKTEAGPRGAEKLKQQFRDAAKGLTGSDPGPAKKSRRRSGGGAHGGFRLSATQTSRRADSRIRRDANSRILGELWSRAASQHSRNQAAEAGGREQASSAGELIGWYLSLGFTIKAIRAMFPGLFANSPPAHAQACETMDSFNPYWTAVEAYADFHPDQHHLSL